MLTEEQIMIRDLARQIAEETDLCRYGPSWTSRTSSRGRHEGHGPGRTCSACISPRNTAASGRTAFELFRIAVEESFPRRVSASATSRPMPSAPTPSCCSGTRRAKKKYLPDIAAGKRLVAFGLTEGDAATTPAASVQARQRRATGNTSERHQAVDPRTAARPRSAPSSPLPTSPKALAALLRLRRGGRTPGFTFGKKENKMGIRASSTTELVFNKCRIPSENLMSSRAWASSWP